MVVTEILRFGSKESSTPTDDTTIREAVESLRESKRARHESLSTGIQNKGTVQITAEWDEDHQIHPGWSHITDNVQQYLGQPNNIFHVELSEPVLGPDGAATSDVVEFVLNYFPVSKATPEFRKQIEADYQKFEKTVIHGLKGGTPSVYGWVLEEASHPDLGDEKAVCLAIVRGWESFEHYERSTTSEEFKAGIPILLGWGAPHEIWHVARKY